MKFLLDTHALAWWLLDDAKLTPKASDAISEPANDIFVSAASAFEIATKYRLGKWPEMELLSRHFEAIVLAERFTLLPIEARHARVAGLFSTEHRDPFDRLLAAQAKIEGIVLISADSAFDTFGIDVIW